MVALGSTRRYVGPRSLMLLAIIGAGLFCLVLLASRCNNCNALLEQAKRNLNLVIHQESKLRERLNDIAGNVEHLLDQEKEISKWPIIYAVTPTYKRFTQKADLVRLSQTFMHIPRFHWILVEDADQPSQSINALLTAKKINFTHLAIKTQSDMKRKQDDPRWIKHRGVDQRNFALKWIRKNIKNSDDIVYFADDDNTYDIELFKEMRFTKMVSVWPVALVGGLRWEGPICIYGKVVSFFTAWQPDREFPLDMAAFAINIKVILRHANVFINPESRRGFLETDFLHSLGITKDVMEPRANNCRKVST
eukprot:gene13631-4531_t